MLGIYTLIWRVTLSYLHPYCGLNSSLGVDKGGTKTVHEKIEEKLEACSRRTTSDKHVDATTYQGVVL